MENYSLLDCTLRDGGYVNDWNFGHSVITSTYKRLDKAGVEFIEVGFIDDRREFDYNRSIVPNTTSFNEIFSGVNKNNAIPVAMIDFGTCSIDSIGLCSESFIDGIRVIFKKEKVEEALPFCMEIKEKGYKLFIQAISITAYSDLELLRYVERINSVKPYAFSIVDTYGLLDNKKLAHYFDMIDNNLDSDISIGYHAHNNFQLAFSNTIKFLSFDTKRNRIADSTIYGMGKSAGNCPSELLAMHMNKQYTKDYNLNELLEALDADLMNIYLEKYWGYKYNYYISAMQECHPDYVQYLLNKKTLTMSSVNEILAHIPYEKKLLYDKEYIEKAYVQYQNNFIDDNEDILKLSKALQNKTILLIGPGNSIKLQEKIIKEYISANEPVIVTVNFVPNLFSCDYVFISNVKRYSKMADQLCGRKLKAKLIITSNVHPFDYEPDFCLNYGSLLQEEINQNDNALLLCLSLFCKIKINNVVLAGFDGFIGGNEEYFDIEYSFAGNEKYRINNNKIISQNIHIFEKKIDIKFLTKSLYDDKDNKI